MDSGGRVASGLSQFVLKVHSRCDLACDHCYVYEHADQSWRRQPRTMDRDVVRATGARIAEHAKAHGLASVRIVLHGGEPLLLGPQRMRELVGELVAALDPFVHVDLRMQTNAVRMSTEFCDLFREFDIKVGVSLDGDRAANDLHRRFRNGGSSYREVVAGVALLRRPEYRRSYAGLLCTVDLANDPVAVYEELLRHEPPRVDFLLPHGTWDHPPARPGGEAAPYARWLATIYDRWLADGRPTGIRLFESLLSTAGGGPSYSEWVGLDPADLVVVETNGEWELADSIKITYDGAPATGMDVFTHSVDDVAGAPGVARRQLGLADLSATCRACPVVAQCGGGLFAHRYSTGRGFDNPSVYCPDLMELIQHMRHHPPAPSEPAAPVPDAIALPLEHLDAIALAGDDVTAVEALASAQLAITRSLLREVTRRWPDDPHVRGGWDLLTAVDQQAPEPTDEVLRHPYVRAWAVGCLSGTGSATPGYLAVVAAAAAIRAEATVTVTVPAQAGQLYLPTLGTAVLAGRAHSSAVVAVTAGGFTLKAGDDAVTVPDAGRETAGWRPIRQVMPGLALEDADPHRDCHKWKPTDRLDDDTAQRWRQALTAASRLIAVEAPARVGGLRVGLRTVVPLHAAPGGDSRASTTKQAFGTIAATLASPAELAVVLVHEFQHNKLNAVLDACDLVDRTDPRRLKVGWRTDARPVVGALHGTFAHQAVADIWRARAVRADAPDAADAWRNYRMYRDWTADAVDTLQSCGALTDLGARFTTNIARSMTAWPD
ncbi:FxsB family cyclophane-forming radical SAM/SPASM peptide maturase [Dactylosporangium sp. NPDC050588]|uniref:FxsB family cyclophane-forming radical SAM/SPASM peptide maturase n=1 Tax=Dactylosporangium sp. NPDC050588 TaxID=3157211 RepID=UPI00340991EA